MEHICRSLESNRQRPLQIINKARDWAACAQINNLSNSRIFSIAAWNVTIRLVNDGDDRMEAKLKTQKNP